jgi:hypothetical protein
MLERIKISRSKVTVTLNIFACALLILLSMIQLTNASSKENENYQAIENDSYTIGVQAYIYGLAPVMMQRTENLFVMNPGAGHALINQMGYATSLATSNNTDVVTPNMEIHFIILHG